MDYLEEFPWYVGKNTVDEDLFCQDFLLTHELICMGGSFFTKEGLVTDESAIRKEIYDQLKCCLRTGLAKKVESILAALRLAAWREMELDDENIIHVANGTYDLYNGFSPEKRFCRHRFPVNYTGKIEPSQVWEDFLQQLLEPEDILTLQEYMGYCLIPTN